ncbi:MAG TPA: isoprenylcysteine carboxylmethyltransferase family protein [Pirellulales bacterium]|jgi:protein-S-isoprenylcysteine O-methyltransferase Ste14|nr:isoprenylcysteine carboxylmethyltransferase family protein [Pirellulales bacterium]
MAAPWSPLVGVLAFIIVALGWRSWLQYRRYGHSGIALFQSRDPLRRIRDGLFCLLFVMLPLQALLFGLFPERFGALMIGGLPSDTPRIGGELLAIGTLLTAAAQLRMGRSWRVGIDETASPGLVTHGLYRFCRNPIYLGMLLALAGLTLLLPTWFSLVFVLGTAWCIRAQTLEEEVYLTRVYGAQFRSYAARVGRFWPGLGILVPRETGDATPSA